MIADLALHTCEIQRPMSLAKYDNQWAIQMGCLHGAQGNVPAQLLVGCDMSHIFPVSVVNPDNTPVQTKNARLLRSMLTGRYLLFGSAEPNDPLLYQSFPVVDENGRAGVRHISVQTHNVEDQLDSVEDLVTIE